MRLFRPGFTAYCLYPEAVFRVKTNDRVLYLTFDDGPDPLSTPPLLDILKRNDVRAVFFCNGEKAEKHSELIKMINESGHIIGNHTYSHFDGWRTGSQVYINNVLRASPFTSGRLFRPPYGHLKLNQYKYLKKDFRIIFWDIMPYDFDAEFGAENSLKVLKDKIRPGSVIVLHDKPTSIAIQFLQEFIVYSKQTGYEFKNEIH